MRRYMWINLFKIVRLMLFNQFAKQLREQIPREARLARNAFDVECVLLMVRLIRTMWLSDVSYRQPFYPITNVQYYVYYGTSGYASIGVTNYVYYGKHVNGLSDVKSYEEYGWYVSTIQTEISPRPPYY